MNTVKGNMVEKFQDESVMDVDLVLERMFKVVGKPLATSYAQAFDVPENTLKTWKRRGAIPLKFLINFAKMHNESLDNLLGREVHYEPTGHAVEIQEERASYNLDQFVMVPRYEIRASAGHGAAIHAEQIVDYLAFKRDWVRNALGVSQKDLALISVKGDSMEPTLSNDDLILIDMGRGRIEDNAVYVLQFRGDLVVKRVQRFVDGSVMIKSDNARYDPETLSSKMAEQLNVVGRVVWAGRRM